MMSTTIQTQLRDALWDGDTEEDLECYYQNVTEDLYGGVAPEIIGPVPFAELPTRPFDAGYGGVNGEPTIAFSPRYIYIRAVYDGSEWFTAIPRHPEVLQADGDIPVVGGG